MRIMILANDDGGLFNFRRELIEALAEKYEVCICVPDGDYVFKLKNLGVKLIPCSLIERHGTNPIKELQLLAWYKNVLRNQKPNVVLTYTIKPNVYGGTACARLHIPYLANITGLGTAVETEGLLQKITLRLYCYGLRKANKVFFQNTENRDFMLDHHVVNGDYSLLPGSGVNLKRYTTKEYPNDEVVNFLFVARIMKEKGIDQYLDAAKEIRKRHMECRFHICGFCEQDYEETLKRLTEDGTVIYHGLVSDMKPIYQMASCLVHPTYYPEGLSNVLLEASATGRPIITTDRAGCREVVDDGVNGYVVKQKDSQDLIDKIEKFLHLSIEERGQMGLAGRAKVEREFDRQIVVQKYMDEIQKIEG